MGSRTHSSVLALKDDGTVWAWSEYVASSPSVRVSELTEVVAIAAGGSEYFSEPHRLALKSDGTVWAWGGNTYGQLDDGATIDRATPVQLQGLNAVVSIAAAGHLTRFSELGPVSLSSGRHLG